MAEKEERIVLTVNVFKEHPCADCGNPYKPNCGNGKFPACDLKRKYKKGLTKETAIERMAKAMCSSDGESCKQCAVKNNKHACKSVLHDELFMQYAKSALNALLGWKK